MDEKYEKMDNYQSLKPFHEKKDYDSDDYYCELLVAFRKNIHRRIDSVELIHCIRTFISPEQKSEIRRKKKTGGNTEAIDYLLDGVLCHEKKPGWFQAFIDGLREADHDLLADQLIGEKDIICHDTYYALLDLASQRLIDEVLPSDIIPHLVQTKTLTRGDIEIIQTEGEDKGPRHAMMVLLDKIPKRRELWFSDLVKALLDSGNQELVDFIEPKIGDFARDDVPMVTEKLRNLQEHPSLCQLTPDKADSDLASAFNGLGTTISADDDMIVDVVEGHYSSAGPSCVPLLAENPQRDETVKRPRLETGNSPRLEAESLSRPECGNLSRPVAVIRPRPEGEDNTTHHNEGALRCQAGPSPLSIPPQSSSGQIDTDETQVKTWTPVNGSSSQTQAHQTQVKTRACSNGPSLPSQTHLGHQTRNVHQTLPSSVLDHQEQTLVKEIASDGVNYTLESSNLNNLETSSHLKKPDLVKEFNLPESVFDHDDNSIINNNEVYSLQGPSPGQNESRTSPPLPSETQGRPPRYAGPALSPNNETPDQSAAGGAQLGAVGGACADITLSLPPEVEPEELMLRPYQKELAAEAMEGNNVIIVAPTGSGKTHVAMGITKRHLEELRDEGSDEGKVVFLVPTVDLVQQQWKQYKQYLSEYTSFGMSGDIGDSQKVPLNELIPGNDIVIMTPQIMVDALKKDHLESLGQFTLMIFDECHHTTKDHPYNGIMKHYMEEKFRDEENRTYILPQIVGLTASVGVGKARDLDGAVTHILTLCANLDSVDVVTVSQTKSELDKHVNKPTEDKIETQGRRHDGFRAILHSIMQTIETFVKQHPGVKKVKEVPNFESLLNPPLNKGSDPYVQWASSLEKGIHIIYEQAVRRLFHSALSHLKVYNRALMINSDCRTKDALVFINKEFKEVESFHKDETDVWLEELFKQKKQELERCNDPNPKLLKLEKIMLDHYMENNDMRGIIFCKTREMTLALQNWMLETPSISHLNPHRIVGGASTEKGGMSQNKQVDVLRYFKDGKHKVIVATSVAEEGLDVRKCDLVIRYEYVTNEIAMVQARGRGRAEDAKYIVLGEKGKGTKEKESLNKIRESMMNKAIQRVKQLDPAEKEQKIRDLQNRLKIEREMADIGKKSKLQARSRNGVDDWVLRCRKCDQFACSSADVRIVESSHHVVMDNTFRERVRIEEHPNPLIYGDFKKTGKVFCGKCKYDWGIVAVYKSVKFEVIKIVSFVVINGRTERRTTCKKWKDAPFPVDQLTPPDLQTRVRSLNDEDLE